MNSRAFREFKTGVGQANHFLITIMIGLDAVEDGAEKKSHSKQRGIRKIEQIPLLGVKNML